MRQRLPLLLVIGAALLLMAASTGEQVRRPQIVIPQSQPTPPGLRGPQSGPTAARATAVAATRVAAARSSRSQQPTIASVPAVDSLQCRAACAQPYYFCLAGAAPEPCPDAWRQCVVGCDWPSMANGGVASATGAPPAR
jgi:hypothetical protein